MINWSSMEGKGLSWRNSQKSNMAWWAWENSFSHRKWAALPTQPQGVPEATVQPGPDVQLLSQDPE